MAAISSDGLTTAGDVSERPFLWELRPDLEIFLQGAGAAAGWVLRDPLRLAFFRTSSSGLRFLQGLGQETLTALTHQLQREFPEEEIDAAGLKAIAMAAAAAGVLRPRVPGLMPLGTAAGRGQGYRLLRLPLSLLSFRWRGIDPQPLLRILYPLVRPLLGRTAVRAGLLLLLFAGLLVLLRIDQLLAELPRLSSLLDWKTAATFAAVFALVRVLHEFGHALVCHHFGGECHELGFLFVCGIPILYCDVSDSWREPDRRRRMAVAGAGIAAELSVAAGCGLLWCFSDAGLLHALFLQTMLLASLNTILVNANPLVRFDGYFIVSDLLNRPNLWFEGRAAAAGFLKRCVLGSKRQSLHADGVSRTGLLALYGVAAWGYSSAVLAGLLLFLASVLEPVGLQALAFLPACAVGVDGSRKLLAACQGGPRTARAAFGAAGLGLLLLLLLLTPVSLPLRVPGIIGPGQCAPLFTTVPGRLLHCVPVGTWLQRGDVLAEFVNSELELELAEAAGEVLQRQTALEALQVSLLGTGGQRETLPVLQEALETAQQRVRTLTGLREQLIIRSPRDGWLFPPRNQPLPPVRSDDNSAPPEPVLQPRDTGVWMASQVLLGWVGTQADLRFEACVEEHVLKRLNVGAPARVRPSCLPLQALAAVVDGIDQAPLATAPRELLVQQLLPEAAAVELPTGAMLLYQLDLRQKDGHSWPRLPLYAPGTASIDTPPLSLASRGWNLVRQTFPLFR
jgi:putative peptide zinc metalloprotease protein